MMKYDPEIVNHVLFEEDPAYTMCQENDCFDEYETIADQVCHASNQYGTGLNESLQKHLYHSFGIRLPDITIADIVDRINSEH